MHTLSRPSFLTALILSLDTAPSGQFNRIPCLKYFDAEGLQMPERRYMMQINNSI